MKNNKIKIYDDSEENYLWGTLREIALTEQILFQLPADVNVILDVGCGDGYLLDCLQKNNKMIQCHGLDYSSLRLQRITDKKITPFLIQGDVSLLGIKDNSYDAVICSEVLEHLTDYKKAILQLIKISKKYVIITVPNDQKPIPIVCPSCHFHHYISGHINQFTKSIFIKEIESLPHVKLTHISSFHTIYSYNKSTLRLPRIIRIYLDKMFTQIEQLIPFLKGNYLIIILEKVSPEP